MCGLVGFASSENQVDEKWLLNASIELTHRGPDDFSHWIDERRQIGFSHRRLSILDISDKGKQPLFNNLKELVIVFNGEIYNYKELKSELKIAGYSFNSNCDTEVLLNSYHYWGFDVLKKIKGMFSFVIYDKRVDKIFAARDKCGQKPFYYTLSNNNLYFSSELKSLIINDYISNNIAINSLDYYLATGHSPQGKTMFESVLKLEPGSSFIYDLNNGNFKTWNYFRINNTFKKNYNYFEQDYLDILEDKLDKSVASQLISDVPIGVCLSGGIDSSLITAFASKHISNLSTFTAIFPENKNFDEGKFARIVAKNFSTNHHEIPISYPSADILHEITKYFDEPLADSSSISTYLLCEAISRHCKVVLGGDGSDELFGGYSHHSKDKSFIERYLPSIVKEKLYGNFLKYFPVGFKGRNLSFNLYCKAYGFIPSYPYLFDHISRQKLLSKKPNYEPMKDDQFFTSFNLDSEYTLISTINDFNNYLSEDILVKSDRASMANSLEIRAPFLDDDLIDFSLNNLPIKYKANKSNNKIILKKLSKKILPKELFLNRKQGFSVPLSDWLRAGSFRTLVYDVLLSNDCFFNKKFVRNILSNQDRGFSNSERIYALVMFELWRLRYIK